MRMSGQAFSCGACKFLRRKCTSACVFAPYFCYEQGAAHFAAVHKVFGASNVSKLLSHLPLQNRREAAISISYEAQARILDPIYGCVAHIFALQEQVAKLQEEIGLFANQMSPVANGYGSSQAMNIYNCLGPSLPQDLRNLGGFCEQEATHPTNPVRIPEDWAFNGAINQELIPVDGIPTTVVDSLDECCFFSDSMDQLNWSEKLPFCMADEEIWPAAPPPSNLRPQMGSEAGFGFGWLHEGK